MNGYPYLAAAGAVLAGLTAAGCGRPVPGPGPGARDHGSHQPGEPPSAPAQFKEGAGLQLSAGTASSIGLRTVEVEERTLRPTYVITASVFESGPPAKASALVAAELAEDFRQHPPAGTEILAIRRELSPALGQVELIVSLPGTPAVGSTTPLRLTGPARSGPAIPRSALVRTATDTFVYVVNGPRLLRTTVRTGAIDASHVEILDGLYAGDVVAADGGEQLWLTELRLTKGGGHSH